MIHVDETALLILYYIILRWCNNIPTKNDLVLNAVKTQLNFTSMTSAIPLHGRNCLGSQVIRNNH